MSGIFLLPQLRMNICRRLAAIPNFEPQQITASRRLLLRLDREPTAAVKP
jgi:hypothetical protein